MKFLKIILIFALFVGVIIFIMNIDNILHKSEKADPLPTSSKLDVRKYNDRIRQSWQEADGWDQALYDNQVNALRSDSTQRYFSAADHNAARNCIHEEAINKVTSSYMSAISDPATYSHNSLAGIYKGVEYLIRHEPGCKTDSRIKNVVDLHDFYTRVYSFINSSHTVSPRFDSEKKSWSSFLVSEKAIISAATSFKNNPKFKTIQNLPGFSARLQESAILDQTRKNVKSFYETLANQIIDSYDNQTFNEFNLIDVKKELSSFRRKIIDEQEGLGGTSYGAETLQNVINRIS